jgi:cobalt-zinc-cadmium efflux system outer membrane protein
MREENLGHGCAARNCGLGLFVALFAAACRAPEPVPVADLEERERGFSTPAPAPAPTPPPSSLDALLRQESLTLEDVLMIADQSNPELASARKDIDLATAAIWDSRLYPNPSLFAEVEDYRTGSGLTLGEAERSLGVSVPLVLSGRLGAAGSAAAKEREVAALRYVWRRREILSGVKHAFWSLLASRRAAELARETRDLARTFHEVTTQRFAAQAIPEMELLRSAVNLAKTENDVKLAEKEADVALKKLHTLMGQPDLAVDRFTGTLGTRFELPALETLREEVAKGHPLLEAAAKEQEAARLRLEAIRRERIPDPELQFSVGRDPDDHTILEGSLAVPLPLFNRNQGRIAAAEIQVRKAADELQSARNDLMLRLTETWRTFGVTQERVATYRDEILPKAEKAVAQTNEAYGLGKLPYLDVLDAQRTLAEARIAYVAALSELNVTAADLERLIGTRLTPIP